MAWEHCIVACAPIFAATSSVGCVLGGMHLLWARFPIGIGILASSKVLALRAVVEVSTSHQTLLEEEDGYSRVPPLTRAHARRLLTSQSSTSWSSTRRSQQI